MPNPSKRKPRIRNRLYNCRKAQNLSQEDAAFLMGMDHSQFSKWERGEKEPGIYNAVGLAVVTGGTVEDVFFDYRQEWQEKIGKNMKLLGSRRQNAEVLR